MVLTTSERKVRVTAVVNYPFWELEVSIFPIPGEINAIPKCGAEMQLSLYFLYPFPIPSIKVFWSSGNIPMYAWTISTVGHLMPIWLPELHSTWKSPLCNLKWFDKGGSIFPVPIPHVHTSRNTHAPVIATKQPAFWRSCLNCAWSSQNLDLGELILLLEIFKVIRF